MKQSRKGICSIVLPGQAVRLHQELAVLQRPASGVAVERSITALPDAANKNFSATRQGWSKGIGGGNAFMKLCASSSGCETRPAQGEPARAGSAPCDGARNGLGDV